MCIVHTYVCIVQEDVYSTYSTHHIHIHTVSRPAERDTPREPAPELQEAVQPPGGTGSGDTGDTGDRGTPGTQPL